MTGWETTHMGTVYPWETDHMNHMNVQFYTAKFDEATWRLFAGVGITPSYLREGGRGMVAVDQQSSYRRELLPGDQVTIRSRIVEMGEKSIRFEHEMINDETGELAATTKLVGVHIDAAARKSTPFPAEITALGQKQIEQGQMRE